MTDPIKAQEEFSRLSGPMSVESVQLIERLLTAASQTQGMTLLQLQSMQLKTKIGELVKGCVSLADWQELYDVVNEARPTPPESMALVPEWELVQLCKATTGAIKTGPTRRTQLANELLSHLEKPDSLIAAALEPEQQGEK